MPISEAEARHQAHRLLDALPNDKIPALRGLLEVMVDPVSRAIANAPLDDEPVTPQEIKALEESREWLKHNEGIPHHQLLAELGITQEEIDRYQEAP